MSSTIAPSSTTAPSPPATCRALALLRSGIPLTLLIDLLRPDPRSAEIYVTESSR